MHRTLLAAALGAAVCFCTPALAQTPAFSSKPIRIVTPYAPGAGTDTVTRIVAKDLGEAWNVPIIVDNKPGATGQLAANLVKTSPADGYTIYLGTSATMVTNPLLSKKLTYDPTTDFVPIGRLTLLSPILVAPPSTPANTMKEVLALARAKPGSLNFASSGNGGPHHLALELMQSLTSVDVVHVPYKGGAPATNDTIAGVVQFGFTNITTAVPHLKSGRLKAIAVGAAKRSAILSDVPTMTESGIAGFEYSLWYGLFAPAATPAAIVARYNEQLRKTLSKPEVVKMLLDQGAEPAFAGSEETRSFMAQETAMWSKVIKQRNLSID